MSTTTVYAIVKQLQAAKGNKEKQAILLEHKDNELFRKYMHATYAVDINYYQKKLPKVAAGNLATMDDGLIDWMYLMLAQRRYTGNEALSALKQVAASLDVEGQELMQYVLDRSIGASVGDSMVLKTWPDLYFIPPYMRCSSMDDKIKAHYQSLRYFFVQTKRDGSFAYLSKKAAYTRQGSKYPQWFSDQLSLGLDKDVVLVGEMEVYENGKLMSRKDGNGVLNSVLSGADEYDFNNYQFRYVAWDRLTQEEFKKGSSGLAYELRLDLLKLELEFLLQAGNAFIELIETHKVTSVADANAIHIDHTKRGLEGTVWKDPSGPWKDSSGGTKYAVKNKVVFEAEYEIVDAYEGEGKAKGMLGGMNVKTKEGKLTTGCGTGFSDDQRKALWAIRDELPGKIATLEANDVILGRDSDVYSLSLPVFIEIRTDKTEADTFERVVEQLEAAKYGRGDA